MQSGKKLRFLKPEFGYRKTLEYVSFVHFSCQMTITKLAFSKTRESFYEED